jgi:hypothetical protein
MLAVVPVRRRPRNAVRLAEAFLATRAECDLLFVADDDDDSYAGTDLPCGELVFQQRMPTSPKVNAAVAGRPGYDGYMFMGDDNVPATMCWDRLMLEMMAETGGMVTANDLSEHAGMPCSVLMPATFIKALGWMTCPLMHHFFVDNVWEDLGAATGKLAFMPAVIIDHRHPNYGRAPRDEIYHLAWQYWDHDEIAYAQWKAERKDADVAAVAGC